MDKVLQLSLRSIVCLLNEDKEKAKTYKNEALELFSNTTSKDKYTYKVEEKIPSNIRKKLYEMVS